MSIATEFRRIKLYSLSSLGELTDRFPIDRETAHEINVVARVFPFRVSDYVLEQLIDWSNFRDDPIFRMVFPQRKMLRCDDFQMLADAIQRELWPEVERIVTRVRMAANPHPAEQLESNVPSLRGERLNGIQHKYRKTILFFPSKGQQCHSFCSYCFRWPQFIGDPSLKLAETESQRIVDYLCEGGNETSDVCDVLFTGGDPLFMSTEQIRTYLKPLVDSDFVQGRILNIRFGTKSLAFWPFRFTEERDSDELIKLLRQLNRKVQISFMLHNSHPRELSTRVAHRAIGRLHDAGVTLRSQAPILRGVNDEANAWKELWKTELKHGIMPYYMFVPRDTGPQDYFGVDLESALDIFKTAIRSQSGIGGTCRGPVLSIASGKIQVKERLLVDGQKHLLLEYLQARDPSRIQRLFSIPYHESTHWLDNNLVEQSFQRQQLGGKA